MDAKHPCCCHAHIQQFVDCMADSLGLELALIAVESHDLLNVETICISNEGRPGSITYAVAHTPCQTTFADGSFVVPANASTLYPNDKPLVDFGTESYAGASFHDKVTGRRGIVAGMSRKPLADPERIEQIMKAFAAGAEAVRIAEAAKRTRDRIVANISHEIRTPMTAIIGHAELLNDADTTIAERRSHIKAITRSGEHLLTIISDILDTAKIESGKLQIEHSTIYPRQLATDVIELHAPKAKRKGIDLLYVCESNVPQIATTDRVRLTQILGNLIDNAIKFTDEGSIVLKVDFEPDTPALVFRVADSGPGVPEDLRQTIFDPFTQADDSPTRTAGGTGLGLNICAKLAELLGGSIELESTEGNGAEFVLRIHPGSDDAGIIQSDDRPEHFSADTLNTKRILLVEDVIENQRLFSHFLTKSGAQVVTADDGELALERFHDSGPFDLIIMDMQMPVMDGYSATRELRELNCPTPILALTAHASPADERQCLATGCTAYLAKPTTRREFIDTCAALTAHASMPSKLRHSSVA